MSILSIEAKNQFISNSNQQIIELLATGLTIKEIGARMGMNKRTVEFRIREMKKDNNARTITQLVLNKLGVKLATYSGS